MIWDRASSPPPADSTQQPKLLERMRVHLRTRHYSIRTEQAYIDWARRFILFHGETTSPGHGRNRGGGVFESFGGGPAGIGFNPESGQGGAAVFCADRCGVSIRPGCTR